MYLNISFFGVIVNGVGLFILLSTCYLLKHRNTVELWVLLWASLIVQFGKESACNAGDRGLIPGLGRSAGEGIGYPLQYSWASLVAQLVKNLAAVQETWVGKSPWRRERLPTPAFWPRNSMDCIVHQVAKSRTQLSNFHFLLLCNLQPF